MKYLPVGLQRIYFEPLPLYQVHVVWIWQCCMMVHVSSDGGYCEAYQLRRCVKCWLVHACRIPEHVWLAWSSSNSFLGRGGYCWLSGLGVGFPSCRVDGWTVSDVNAISIFLHVSPMFSIFFIIIYFALCCSMLLFQLNINYKISTFFQYFSVSLCSPCFYVFLYFALMS